MKVIIVGPAYPYRGGIADTNESLCRSFIEEGHEAELVTFTLQYPNFLFPGKTQFSNEKAPEGLNIHRWINTVNPFNWVSSARKIRKLKPDLIIFRYWIPFLGPCLGTIARLTKGNIKVVALCDNVFPHEARIGDKLFSKYFMKSFHGFITLSKATHDELAYFTKKPSTYFPHPINDNLGKRIDRNEALKKLNLDPTSKYLLFFGLVRKYKGLDLTLQALAQEKLKKMPVKLIIAGEFYDDPQVYTEMIEELGLEDKVIIHNEFIPNEEIATYFSAADLAIQTYHTASQSGVTQLAFNFDRPILVTNVGGLGEMVKHDELGYVCEKDPEAIANSVMDFFMLAKKEAFEQNVAIAKKEYTWKNFIQKLTNLYRLL